MLMKSIAAGLAGSALLVSVAFAQSTTATSDKAPTAAATTAATSASGDWRASKVVGLKVYNEANESVGSINDLLMDKTGNIRLVVLGVGGFLGMGEHLVAVPFDKVKFSTEPVAYAATNASPPGAPANRPATGTTPPATTTGAATDRPAAATTTSKWYPDHAVFNATKDELKNMTEFKYD
jgi:sporulation protein YlmC with PRC-barrel domain